MYLYISRINCMYCIYLVLIVCIVRAVYRIFAKGGRTWSMSKRGGARLFVTAGQPQGGGGFKGGARITQGGANSPPLPPKYTPVLNISRINCMYCIYVSGINCMYCIYLVLIVCIVYILY